MADLRRINSNRKVSKKKYRILGTDLTNDLDFCVDMLEHVLNKCEHYLLSSSTVAREKKLEAKVDELIKDQNGQSDES